MITSTLLHWDRACFQSINKFQALRWLAWICRVVSFLGDGYLYGTFGVYLLCCGQDTGMVFLSCLLAFGFDVPSFVLLKKIFRRPRPFMEMQPCLQAFKPADEFSMPSGHAAAAALFSWQILCFYPEYALGGYIWAFMVGLSRVVLGVHYPLDVLFGFGLGMGCSMLGQHLMAVWLIH